MRTHHSPEHSETDDSDVIDIIGSDPAERLDTTVDRRSRPGIGVRAGLAVALATLGVAMTLVAPGAPAADAVTGGLRPTAVRCFAPHGELATRVNITGYHDRQWVATRHHLWTWVAGRWTYAGTSDWHVSQAGGPGMINIGGDVINAVRSGTYIHFQTDASFWTATGWSQIQRAAAHHYQNMSNTPLSWCVT